jgi:hypothetical protein
VPVKPLVKAAILSVAALGMGGLVSCSATATSSGHARRRPVYGGTLRVISDAGPGSLDPVPTYNYAGYELERGYARQLVTYPTTSPATAPGAAWARATTLVPDIAAQMPTAANGGVTGNGLVYTYHLRSGVEWNSSPPRQVTAADFIREFQAFWLRIMFTEILPNLARPVLVLATLSIPSAIIFEATLSFLGLGVQPPAPSWGNILAGAQNYYSVAWWYLVFPALALLMTTLAFNLLGDGIRDALDQGAERLLGRAGARRRSGQRRPRSGWRRLSRPRRSPVPAPASARQPVPVAAPAPVPAAARDSGATIARGRPPSQPAPAAVARQEPWPARFARSLRGGRTVLAAAVFVIVANILVDIAYTLLDPRVRLS